MRSSEANWIASVLQKVDADTLSPILEFGSSTLEFRTRQKPHVESQLHRPLRDSGIRIVTTDLKDGKGIDISGDVYADDVFEKLRAVEPKCIMLCNIFEHVTDPQGLAARCADLVPIGGRAVVTVPYSYPYHLDPIDTMYRPGLDDISQLFPNFELETGEVLTDTSHWTDVRRHHGRAGAAVAIAKAIAKSLILRNGLEASKARLHRLLWLARPFKITAGIWKRTS